MLCVILCKRVNLIFCLGNLNSQTSGGTRRRLLELSLGQLSQLSHNDHSPRLRRSTNATVNNKSNMRHLLQTEGAVTVPSTQEVNNPMICLQLNEALLFRLDIDTNNRSASHYPTYIKDHLFNTNPDFDFGDFTQLAYYITQTNVTYEKFIYVFTSAGTYVFADAQNAARFVINPLVTHNVAPLGYTSVI